MKIDAVKLREYLNTMHGHADARDVQSESIRKVIQVAKGDGFDGKALRKVFVRERMEPEQRQKDDDTVALYEGALGAKGRALRAIADGVPVGEAAKANGVHRATVARARHVAKQAENATPTHDAETGEITETQAAGPAGSGEGTAVPSSPAPTAATLSSGPSVQGRDGAAQAAAGPLDPNSDGLDIPPALRRTRAA